MRSPANGAVMYCCKSACPCASRDHAARYMLGVTSRAYKLLTEFRLLAAGVQGLLGSLDAEGRYQLLNAVTVLSAHSAPRSAVRAACLDFQANIVAAPASWHLVMPDMMTSWLQARCCSLPAWLLHDLYVILPPMMTSTACVTTGNSAWPPSRTCQAATCFKQQLHEAALGAPAWYRYIVCYASHCHMAGTRHGSLMTGQPCLRLITAAPAMRVPSASC